MPIVELDVRWFCYLSVHNHILRPADLAQLLHDMGPETNPADLAQHALDQGFTRDVVGIRDVVNESAEHAAEHLEPPVDDTPPEPIEPDDAPHTFPEFEPEDLDIEQAAQLLVDLLLHCRDEGAGDLHLCAGARPFRRRNGAVEWLGTQPLHPETAIRLNTALLDEEELARFERAGDLAIAIELPDNSRYRVNLMQHNGGLAGTYHLIPTHIPTLEQLGFPNAQTLEALLDHHNGLILVTGPEGCGKTTTLAAMVDALNRKRYCHVITVEAPIEIVIPPERCHITQRQVGLHTDSYAAALKGALREDPDIIVIGEMHDLETIEMAISAAETGHLVLGTLNTRDAGSTLNRILGVFPPAQQPQIRAMTSESLRGILCQRFLPNAQRNGRVLACELLVATSAVANLIREGRTHHLEGIMQTGTSEGMRSMDQSVLDLYRAGNISRPVAETNLRSRQALAQLDHIEPNDEDEPTPLQPEPRTKSYPHPKPEPEPMPEPTPRPKPTPKTGKRRYIDLG